MVMVHNKVLWRTLLTRRPAYCFPKLDVFFSLVNDTMPVPTHSVHFRPVEKAQFATTARLLSCLVTESLVHAFYQPVKALQVDAAGFAVILNAELPSYLERSTIRADDILAIVALHHPPVFKPDGVNFCGKEIGLLDPLDMIPFVLETGGSDCAKPDRGFSEVPLAVWSKPKF